MSTQRRTEVDAAVDGAQLQPRAILRIEACSLVTNLSLQMSNRHERNGTTARIAVASGVAG